MTTDEKKLTVRLPDELHERLMRSAKTDRRSLNGQIVKLLEEALAARETQKERP